MAKHAFDPARKIELLHQISELHEIGGDNADAAFATFSRALREDPRNETTHAPARSPGPWPRQVARGRRRSTTRSRATRSEDDLKVALLFRRAQIQEHELRDDKGAVETYERVLKASPSTVEAATAIQTIHERTGDWPKLVDILKRKSEILPNVDERKQLLYRAAQIEEEVLGNADAAIATFRQVLSIDDVDMVAMDALERLYVRLARWEPLKDVYAKKADLAEDPDDKKRMLYVLAQVYDRELGDVAKAIETYQGILDLDADELPAIQSLDRLYGAGRALVRPARRTSSARSSSPRPPARPSRSSTASVTCGSSGSATSRARSRAIARRSRSIRRTPRRCTRSTGSSTARSSRSWRLACSSRSTRPPASSQSSSTSSR